MWREGPTGWAGIGTVLSNVNERETMNERNGSVVSLIQSFGI